jgi:ArsR family transcriptional regulator, virulence genes transcriptional regulator
MKDNLLKIRQNAPAAAKLLKALANSERLMILCQLLEGEQCAGVLWERSTLSQSAFSQHLAVLRRDGLVKTRKEAQTVHYSLANDYSTRVLRTLQEIYC